MKNELEKIAYVYGDVCIRKQRRKRQKLLITELMLDYAKNSTLHGLRYITEKGLKTVEKLFWIITFVVSACFCSYLIFNVYHKWKTSPVIVTVSERLVSVGEVPFPSVTICPQIKCRASKYNFSREIDDLNNRTLYNETSENLTRFADIAIVCKYDEDYQRHKREYTDASIIEHIDDVAPILSNTLIICNWGDSNATCNDLFKKVYTAEGVCFNMNGLSADDLFRDTVQSDYKYSESNETISRWSLEDGYLSSHPGLNYFPKRGSENSASPDLEVVLRSNSEDYDVLCNGLNSGYKIYIQHPADFPQSSMYYYAALNNQVSSLAVSFNYLQSSNSLESYDTEVRQCYFPKNRQLRYFKVYTAKNCRAECLSNYTFETCDCVGYYMPHDNSSQICAEGKLECMRAAHQRMAGTELHLELEKSPEGCRCLPACNTVEYDAEILKTNFHMTTLVKKYFGDLLSDTVSFSKIEIYFKRPQFVAMRRSELFGLTDFLANIGGLLGVFLGFSFLSFVEIVYFITLRLGYTLRRDLKEEKKKRANSIKIQKVLQS